MTRWLSEPESRAWRGFLEMRNRLDERLARDLLPFGLSMPDYGVLVNLSEAADHRMRMHELATHMQWSRSRLSHHVARMETRGLVKREDCPSDARGAHVRVTEDGLLAIKAAAPAHLDSVRSSFINVLTPGEITTLGELATRVTAHLGGASGMCPTSAPQDADVTGCP